MFSISELPKYLDSLDDAVNLYAPLDFDFDSEQRRLQNCMRELSISLECQLCCRGEERFQDSPCYGAIALPSKAVTTLESTRGIYFSRFGRLATFEEDGIVTAHAAAIIKQVLEKHGFVYVSPSIGALPTQRDPENFPTWNSRFFDDF